MTAPLSDKPVRHILALSDRCVRSLARKFARRTGGVESLPPEIDVPATPEEWDAISETGRILGLAAFQKGKKAVFRIPPERRDPSQWSDLRVLFAKKDPGDDPSDEALRRARLISDDDVVAVLKDADAVVRFLRREDGASRDFIRMLEWAVKCFGNDAGASPTTLSQLGADILGDSKALRSGTRRIVFERVLCAVAGLDADESGREAFARFGIEENPFTSFVTVFAPFSFALESGKRFDYPAEMFRAGLAVQLPRQTVMRMCDVRLTDGCGHIVTSENAAPFEALVREGVPSLYTEGYPNAAVIRLLELFAARGATADHAGDGDLDGFLIAERISKAITVRRVIAAEVADDESMCRRPVSPQSRKRWEAFLATHGGFPYADAVRTAIEHGWIEQESAFPATAFGGAT